MGIEKAGWWATVVASAAVPVVFFPSGTSPFALPKLTLLWICTSVAVAGAVVAWLRGRRPTVPPTAWPLVALVTLVALATALSTRPWVSLMGRYGRYGGLVSLVTYVLFGVCVIVMCWGRADRLRALARAVAVGGVAGAIYVLLQVLRIDFDWSTTIGAQPDSRFMGAQGNSNFAGAHLAIVLPLLAYLRVAEAERWARRSVTAAMPLVAVSLGFAGSRGAWIAAFAGMSVALFLDRRLGSRWLAAVVALIAVAGFAAIVAVLATRGSNADRTWEQQSVLRRQTLEQRADMWVVAVELSADHPILGTGPDTFAHELLPYAGDVPDLARQSVSLDAPHNILLAYAVGAGIPAAAAWLAVMITVWVSALRRRPRLDRDRAALLAGFGGGLAGYLAQGMLSIDVVPLAFLGWLCVAAVTSASFSPACVARDQAGSMGDTEKGSAGDVAVGVRQVPAWVPVVVTVVAIGLVSASVLPLVADIRVQRALDSVTESGSGDPGTYIDRFRSAMATNPVEPRLWLEAARRAQVESDQMSDRETRIALLGAGLDLLDRSLDLAPGEVDAVVQRARILERLGLLGEPGRFEEADRTYSRMLASDPYDPQLRFERARLLHVWLKASGRAELAVEAKAELDSMSSLRHTWAHGWLVAARLYLELGYRDEALSAARRSAEIDPRDGRAEVFIRELGA